MLPSGGNWIRVLTRHCHNQGMIVIKENALQKGIRKCCVSVGPSLLDRQRQHGIRFG